jgi:hypothetical protein
MQKPGIPKWAKWKVRDSAGWTEFFQNRPRPHISLEIYWSPEDGKSDTESGESYFGRQKIEPKWWFRKGPLPFFFWVLVSLFTLRRVKR